MRQHLKALLLIFLLGFLAYSNGLSNPFLIDDHAFFEEKLRNIKFLPLHFLPDKNRALHIEGESADPFYRPLATVVPMLNCLAFKDNPTGYHIVNLVLLCLAAWAIYLFLGRLGAGYLWALLAAVFYVVHPINDVVVNYITASIFPVQVMLMLGALYFLEKNIIVSCLLYLFSTWCHEMAMMLPFYAFILKAVFDDSPQRLSNAWRKTWPLFATLGAICVFRIFYSSLGDSILNKISLYQMNFAEFLATWTMLLSWYLSRLFWMQNIVLIMAHQPLKEGVGIWLLVLPLLMALAGWLLWHFRRDKVLFLGLAWFVAGFVPFTLACFFQPIHGLMIEPHWFVFPVMGFFVFLAGIFVRIFNSSSRPWLARVGLAVFVFTAVFFSRWHNFVWGDEVRYCKFWLAQSPAFVAVNGYIAKAYEFRKDYANARKHYYYMLHRGYKDNISYTNLGLMDEIEGNWESAKRNLLKVLEIDPYDSVAVNDLGVIYFKDGNYPEALKYFERARDLNRFLVLPYLDISKAQLKLGDTRKAIEALEQVLNIVPGQEQAMVDLIQIYMAQKDNHNTIKIARMMSSYSRNPYTLRNASILLKSYGFSNEAQKALNKAQRMFNNAK